MQILLRSCSGRATVTRWSTTRIPRCQGSVGHAVRAGRARRDAGDAEGDAGTRVDRSGFDGLEAVPVSSRHAEHDVPGIPDDLASARPPRVRLAEALRPGSGPGTRPIALSPRPPFGLRLRQEVLLLRQAGSSPEAHLAPAPAAAAAPAPAPAWRP